MMHLAARTIPFTALCTAAALLGTATPAMAGSDLIMGGSFRVRGRMYSNLDLQADAALTTTEEAAQTEREGRVGYLQQRLRLNPELRVNENLSVFAQIDVLPDLVWGTSPERLAGLGDYYEPIGYSQSFSLPAGSSAVAPRRVWGELYTQYGRLKVGRTGMQVGSGVFFNDGNAADGDYGDTADRAQILTRIGRVYALLGYDLIYEGSLDRAYDAQAFAAALAWRSELVSTSLYAYIQSDASWIDEASNAATQDQVNQNDMRTVTLDLWGKAKVGPLDLELEALYRFGGGEGTRLVYSPLDSDLATLELEDVKVNQFGGIARASYTNKAVRGGLEFGMASGDPDQPAKDSDNTLKGFAFDRDYHVGLLLFRVPMPVRLSKSTDVVGTEVYEDAIVGDAITNAIYLLPSVQYTILDNLSARASVLVAWAMDESVYGGANDYGVEVDLEVNTRLYEKLSLGARGAVFFPGAVFDETREFAFGGELQATVEF